mmetsp:Transcript_3162/g.10901  ORF Transcript_3162/g.10901 Transcript_3162/m.10901 type:complete len:359 (+) Transcript_3162:171-1247(+)
MAQGAPWVEIKAGVGRNGRGEHAGTGAPVAAVADAAAAAATAPEGHARASQQNSIKDEAAPHCTTAPPTGGLGKRGGEREGDCVCVCVWESLRDRESERERARETQTRGFVRGWVRGWACGRRGGARGRRGGVARSNVHVDGHGEDDAVVPHEMVDELVRGDEASAAPALAVRGGPSEALARHVVHDARAFGAVQRERGGDGARGPALGAEEEEDAVVALVLRRREECEVQAVARDPEVVAPVEARGVESRDDPPLLARDPPRRLLHAGLELHHTRLQRVHRARQLLLAHAQRVVLRLQPPQPLLQCPQHFVPAAAGARPRARPRWPPRSPGHAQRRLRAELLAPARRGRVLHRRALR